MLFAMRISLLDEPGSLGAVATALSHAGANVVTLDVIDRGSGLAVDDICVEAADDSAETLRHAVEWVPGAIVEAMRPVESAPDILEPMRLAAELSRGTPDQAIERLVEGLPAAMWASWSAAVEAGSPQPRVLAASRGAPSLTNVDTPWLPLEGPRHLPGAMWMPPAWRMGPGFEVAAAPLSRPNEAVMLVRRRAPRFRPSELRELGFLAQIAAATQAGAVPVSR